MYKILHKFAKPVGRDIRYRRLMEDDAVASMIQRAVAGETSR
jgi:hypothetical protein